MSEPVSLSALRSELFDDPAQIGYARPMAEGDQNEVFLLLNMAREGGAYLVDRAPVTPSDLFGAIEQEDFTLLTTTELARLQVILTVPRINLALARVHEMVKNVFTPGALTRQNLVVLQKRPGSRAEVLFGPGTIITLNEIDLALNA